MERQKIQVFGLQRSGTNFIEWTLIHNFTNSDYVSMSSIGNVPGDERFDMVQSLKHCYPTLDYSDYIIVIQRDYPVWINSLRKRFRKCKYTEETYDEYYTMAKNLDQTKTIVVNHKWVIDNYFEFLDMLSDRFGLIQVENPTQPTKRVGVDGGRSLTNKAF